MRLHTRNSAGGYLNFGNKPRFRYSAWLLLAGSLLGSGGVQAIEDVPMLDLTKLLGEAARSQPLAVTVEAWNRGGRTEEGRYFRTTSSSLGVMYTDLSSLQTSLYMRRARIRTEFGSEGDPFETGAVVGDSTLTVDCRTMTYQHGGTQLRDRDGRVTKELGELSELADSKREGPWYEASMLLCSS